jgi:hypothetical protein
VAKEPTNLCRSGSGKKCKGTFAPGGDARYKSDLINRVVAGTEPSPADRKAEAERLRGLGYDDDFIKEHAASTVSVDRARAILHDRNWDHFLNRKVQADERKAAKQAAAAAERAKAADKAIGEAKKEKAKASA